MPDLVEEDTNPTKSGIRVFPGRKYSILTIYHVFLWHMVRNDLGSYIENA